MSYNFKVTKNKTLKIDKHLPQIILPYKKNKMFIDWWNSDIRFEKNVPHSFNEGYLIVETTDASVDELLDNYKNLIKDMAKNFKTTYRNIENQFREFFYASQKLTLYFKFLEDENLIIETYGNDNKIFSTISCKIGNVKDEPEKEVILNQDILKFKSTDDIMNNINFTNLALLITCLWYIATTSRTTKYIYEKKTPVIAKRHKNIVKVSDTKTITTPIYDMNKIRVVKVESLSTRKKGWTYSHAFQVHGHYRHYKSGKVVFINSFIKGKNKDFKAQTITINPDKL